jgi:hypothetical protein
MSNESKSLASNLIEILERLETHRIHYRLEHTRPESILVNIAVSGERWEVEFLADGGVEVERFASDGGISGAGALESIFVQNGSEGSDGRELR